jgi:hypothetical protein
LINWLQKAQPILHRLLESTDAEILQRVGKRTLSGRFLKEEVVRLSDNPFLYLQEVENVTYPDYLHKDISRPTRRNGFLMAAMQTIGGGEQQLLSQIASLERRGGGIDDGVKYIRLHDRTWALPRFSLTPQQAAEGLGLGRTRLKSMKPEFVRTSIKHNLDAHPGPTYRAIGFQKKGDGIPAAWYVARTIIERAFVRDVVGFARPRYQLAGRTKLRESSEFEELAVERKPFGRAVWMADQHEQYIAARFGQPLLEFFAERQGVIQLGFNKFGTSPEVVSQGLENFNTYINVDFSKFDQSVSPGHLKYAFDVIRSFFGEPRASGSQDDRLLNWLEDEVVDSHVVLPTGRVVVVSGGVPSGSGLTAILNSIVCAVVLSETLQRLGKKHCLFVQGDDATIGVNFSGGETRREILGRAFVERISDYVLVNHGFVLNPEKTSVATRLFVGYASPRVRGDIRDSSRLEVSNYRNRLKQEVNRPLTFSEKFEVLAREPIGAAPGATHRWTYIFHRRACFLSHYFKRGRGGVEMVRPTSEVVARLLIPETKVRNLDDHIGRIASVVAEHLGNHHVVNHCMHYAYDAYLLRCAGVSTMRDLRLARQGAGCFKSSAMERRGWYRKIDYTVDLLSAEPEFSVFWNKLYDTAVYLHGATYGTGSVDWSAIRALRRCRVLYTGTGGLLGSTFPPRGYDYYTTYALQRIQQVTFGWVLWQSQEARDLILPMVLQAVCDSKFDVGSWLVYNIKRGIRDLCESGRELVADAQLPAWGCAPRT